ncbi:hypothetical protein G4228_002966 [Cervus hanglu yarkandensis]|nr:hypothetical protein G4228_002966 [Cervus hanglu yarkandensis]
MAQPHRATWLPPALLLLWVPGCLSLSGPKRVTGIVGGSLSVECRYQEEFINNPKYWCKFSYLLSRKIVETRESEREVRRGRVSIKDHPGNLTFTVTLESLREEDAGTYGCGIDVPLSLDPTFQVEVSVIPAGEKPEPPQSRSQAAEQTEPCYANLELQTRPLSGKPIQPTRVEVEYSTVGPPSDNLQYTSVVFDSQRQDSKACRIPSETPVYSVIKKT